MNGALERQGFGPPFGSSAYSRGQRCHFRVIHLLSDCANLVIRRYDDESSDYSNLPNYLTTIYGLRG